MADGKKLTLAIDVIELDINEVMKKVPNILEKPKDKWTEAEKIAKREVYAIAKGYKYKAQLVNIADKKVVFTAPHCCKTPEHAYRKGEQFKQRYDRNGDFNAPLGGGAVVMPAKMDSSNPAI